MEPREEQIQKIVNGYQQDMLDFYKELVNFQAGSKEGKRIYTLMENVLHKLQTIKQNQKGSSQDDRTKQYEWGTASK